MEAWLPRQGRQKSLGLASPELRYGTKHALIFEDEILLDRCALELSIRVFGDNPSLRCLHYFIKFEWDIKSNFMVHHFKDSTYALTFSTILDFLRAADRTWSFIDDRVIRVSRGSPELLHSDNFQSLPQWVIITGLSESMWAKGAISAIVSTLGVPLEAEHLFSKWGHALRACVMMEFTKQLLSVILAITFRGGVEKWRR